ncbi:hypothetical protein THAOC_17596, partial [Thalassiosira oceanica]
MSANSTVVAAGVSATLQLLRVVADLVTVASRTAKRNEAEIENAKSPPSPDADKKGDGGGGWSRRGFSVRNFDGRLSAVSARGSGDERLKSEITFTLEISDLPPLTPIENPHRKNGVADTPRRHSGPMPARATEEGGGSGGRRSPAASAASAR